MSVLVEHYDPEVDTDDMACPHCGENKMRLLRKGEMFSIACFGCFAATPFVESPTIAFSSEVLCSDEKMEGN